MKVVMSLGGSVVGFPPSVGWLKSFASLVREFSKDVVAVVVGGGPLAREMMRIGSELGASKHFLDRMGIQATVLNAYIVGAALGDVAEVAGVYHPERASEKIPVYGGSLYPGLTTDFVGALLAERNRADFLNITRVGGLYDRDPDRFPDAKLIRRVRYVDVEGIIFSSDRREPGTNFPLDLAAFSILRRSGLKTYIVGPDLDNIRRLLRGEEWLGTEILP